MSCEPARPRASAAPFGPGELGAERLVEALASRIVGLQAVYLYGSRASGEVHAESDLDLGVLAARPVDGMMRWQIAADLETIAGCPVDLVDLRSVPTVLQMQVVSRGRVVHDGDPAARGCFEDFVFSSYARLNEERAGILADVTARGTVLA